MGLKQRKPNRIQNYEYLDGHYFVTVCTDKRKEYFGDVKNNKMTLNQLGKITEKQWLWLKENFIYVRFDKFIIMPNHFHGIIIIDTFNTGDWIAKGKDLSKKVKIKPLSQLIGAFKTTSSKLVHKAGFTSFAWQRSFFDRVIRNQKELDNIRDYITANPYNWEQDRNNQENIFM